MSKFIYKDTKNITGATILISAMIISISLVWFATVLTAVSTMPDHKNGGASHSPAKTSLEVKEPHGSQFTVSHQRELLR